MPNKIYHTIPPIFDKESKILILGSLPSFKSREEKFYYAHPKNRFWKILAITFDKEIPKTIEDKKNLLRKHHVALWDVISSCEIKGSSDSSIKNVIPNDLNIILKKCKIAKIFTLGKTATNLYKKYCYPKTNIESIYLPSTSPANCAIKDDKLIKEFKKIRD